MNLAPNGKPSNLTPEQYALVRTPAFKKWFGDWESSPETASKVVDKNGEPLPVYHGSPNNDIKKFKPNYDGIFFSDKLEVASSVSGSELITENKITKAEKKILDKEYDDIYDYNFLFNDLKKIGYKIDISRKEFTDKYGNTELNNVAEITNLYGEKQIHKLDYFRVDWQKRGIILRGRNYQVFLNIRNPLIVNAKGSEWDNIEYEDKIINSGDIGVLAQKNKNDGSIIKNLVEYYIISDVFLVFNSNQIKLADGTNTTFDSNNPDIRYGLGGSVVSSRLFIPNVRGGWTKDKIIKYFKLKSSDYISTLKLLKYISEFDNWQQFKNHIYYHGTQSYIERALKPSITMSEREAERIGGGGYGQRYFGISLTKRKRTAESFSGMSSGVTIYPVILKRDANVIERTDLKDAADIEDIIVELYEKGVDAVWIGGGEEELVVVNPYSVLLYKNGKEYHSVYGGFKSIPLTDEKIKEIYDNSKNLFEKYLEEYNSKQNKEERESFTSSLPNIQFELGGELTLTSEQVEQKLGRALHWWNDDSIEIEGKLYKKVYLRPEYKLI